MPCPLGCVPPALLAALLLGAGAAPSALAAFPGANGRIAYSSAADGDQDVYVMNSNGGATRKLTDSNHADIDPVWSADGSKIVFSTSRYGNFEIATMNADGSDVT